MFISIKKTLLENVLVNCNGYLDKKDISNVTSHILINAANDKIIFKATDNEIGLTYQIDDCVISQEGVATVNGKKFLDIVRSLKDEMIDIKAQNNYIHITQSNYSQKLPMQNANEFPDFPSKEGKKKFNINAALLSKNLKKISETIDQTIPKREVTGALIDVNENFINLVATDTKMLSIYKMESNSQQKEQIILPKKAVLEIQKIFFENDIEIFCNENTFIAVGANFEFFTKIINGKFPDYTKIANDEAVESFKLKKEDFKDEFERASKNYDIVKIIFNKNEIIFESKTDDGSEVKNKIEVNTNIKGEEISFGIKSKYLNDFLKNAEEDEFELKYSGKNRPIVLLSGKLKSIIVTNF